MRLVAGVLAIAAAATCRGITGSVALSAFPSQAGTLNINSEVDTSDPLFNGSLRIDLTPFSVSQGGIYSFQTFITGTLSDPYAFLFLQGSALDFASALTFNDDAIGLASFFTYNLTAGTNYIFGVRGFGGVLGTYQATISGPGDITVVPTPALLPGLIGLGVAALRKRKQEQSEAEV